MSLIVHYLLQLLQILVLLPLLLQLLLQPQNIIVSAQWITVAEFSMRVSGRCASGSVGTTGTLTVMEQQQFDCGSQQQLQHQRCIPLQRFHDGIVDCPDGSDEFCFPGYVKCGSYCVAPQYTAQCLVNPRCDNSPTSPTFCDVGKEKLCPVPGTIPCKGYGECVMRKWIEEGRTSCIDRSDEDPTYIAVFGIKRGTKDLVDKLSFLRVSTKSSAEPQGGDSDGFSGVRDIITTTPFTANWLQSISVLTPSSSFIRWTEAGNRDANVPITGAAMGNESSAETLHQFNNNPRIIVTTEPTTTRFVFRMPDNDAEDQNLGPLLPKTVTAASGLNNIGTTVAELNNVVSPADHAANAMLLKNHTMQNSQNFNHSSEHSSNGTRGIFEDYGVVRSSDTNNEKLPSLVTENLINPGIGRSETTFSTPESSFIYRPGGNPSDQYLENSGNFATLPPTSLNNYNWLYGKLDGAAYEKLLPTSEATYSKQSASNIHEISGNSNQKTSPQNWFPNESTSAQNIGKGAWTSTVVDAQQYKTSQKQEQQNQHGIAHAGAQLPQSTSGQSYPISTNAFSLLPPETTHSQLNPPPNSSRTSLGWGLSRNATDIAATPSIGVHQIAPSILMNTPKQQQQSIIHGSQNETISAIIATSVSATTTPSADQQACARYEYAEARKKVPNPMCACPAGQMPTREDGKCKETTVSTFGVDMSQMCAGIQIDPEERARLAILALGRTQLPYQACVRRDGDPVLVQVDCSQCTEVDLAEAFKQNAKDHYLPLNVMKLSLGACLAPSLNDCDLEHADCLVDGPRYRCQCQEGWNDTSHDIGKPSGRRCEQLLLLADGCIPFLGFCLLWWFLLLGVMLFLVLPLLCCAGYWIYNWFLNRRRKNVVDEQGHLIVSEQASVGANNPVPVTVETNNFHSDPTSARSSKTCEELFGNTKDIPGTSDSDRQRVLLKQQTTKSLDAWRRNGDIIITGTKKTRSVKSEQAISGSESGRLERARQLVEIFGEHAAKVGSRVSSQEKLGESPQEPLPTQSTEVPVKPPRNVEVASVVAVQGIKVPEASKLCNGNVGKFTECTDSKMVVNEELKQLHGKIEKNASQSSSEASLRTMWELFKQSAWKQSSRPSSIKSSTPSLDRLIDVFICRKNNKIHPVTTEVPLGPMQSSEAVPAATATKYKLTTATNSNTTATITTSLTAPTSAPMQPFDSLNTASNTTVEPLKPSPAESTTHVMQQVVEQKIVTETKTFIATSTVPVLPGEVAARLEVRTATVQMSNPVTTATAANVTSQCLESDDEQSSQSEAPSRSGEVVQQSPPPTENVKAKQIAGSERDRKEGTCTTKLSTTTVVNSSDAQLKRRADAIFPAHVTLRKTQSEHGGRLLTVPQEEGREKSPPTAEELREALKEVASMRLPTKRLTEKQKEKLLSASCEHLQIKDDNKNIDKSDGSLGQLLATSSAPPRSELRRKLSSISEKSAELASGGDDLKPAPSSISCPTTTRISKDHKQLPHTLQKFRDGTYGTRHGVFADLRAPFTKKSAAQKALAEDTTRMSSASSTVKRNLGVPYEDWDELEAATRPRRRKLPNDSGWRQRPIAVVDARPPWNSSPLKEGELDRIAPLRPVFPRHHQQRKWLSASHLDGSRDAPYAQEDVYKRRQSDWNLHEASQTHPLRSSHLRARFSSAAAPAQLMRGSGGSGVLWTSNGAHDSSKPIKEQLWWGVH